MLYGTTRSAQMPQKVGGHSNQLHWATRSSSSAHSMRAVIVRADGAAMG